MSLGHLSIDKEVLVVDYNFRIKVSLLLLLALLFLKSHAVSRLEHCLEVPLMRESLPILLHLVHEDWLALVLWSVLFPCENGFCVHLLVNMRLLQFVNSCLVGLLGMLVPI